MLVKQRGLISRYKFEKEIGSGSFGVVYLATDTVSGAHVAIKRTTKRGATMSREYKLLSEVKECENIVRLVDAFYTYTETSIIQNLVFEHFPTNLKAYSVERYKNSPLSHIEIAGIMKQILTALDFLHSKNIMHRDVKPENILIDPKGLKVKLCDLGSAKKAGGEENTPYIVSRYYRAPELVYGNYVYSDSIDIWAAGCVLMELYIGKPIFMGVTDGNQFIQQVFVLGPPTLAEFTKLIENSNISAKLVTKATQIPARTSLKELLEGKERAELAEDLVKMMLSYDSSKRPSAKECLSHSFFKIDN